MSIILGLTGPTGAGKSSLTAVAEDLGYKVIDCDKAARQATLAGSDGLNAVASVFGGEILNADGSLNRAVLAQKAFSTPENTELLNKTLLPFIVQVVLEQCEGDKILLDAPTLIESGLHERCHTVITAWADEGLRLERIMARDGIDKEAALLRIKAGKPLEYYIEHSHYIIYNDADNDTFKSKFAEILNGIKER